MVGMGSPARLRRRLLRWWFWLVGSDGWGRSEVRLRRRAAVQAPGQSVGVLASLPAAGLPGFLELNHTAPTSPPHPTLDPHRTIHGAHGGPPDRVKVLQRVGRGCHGRIILTANPTRKTSQGDPSGSHGRGRDRPCLAGRPIRSSTPPAMLPSSPAVPTRVPEAAVLTGPQRTTSDTHRATSTCAVPHPCR
jgi:hypothetical protein